MRAKPETTNPIIIASQIYFIHGRPEVRKIFAIRCQATPRFARPQPFERHGPCSIQTSKQK